MILDLMMKEMDGFQVLRRIKENPRLSAIPVLVVSGKELTREEIDLLARERIVFFPKGTGWKDELIAELHKAVGQKTAQ